MGIEVREVPGEWEHPTLSTGKIMERERRRSEGERVWGWDRRPLLDRSWAERLWKDAWDRLMFWGRKLWEWPLAALGVIQPTLRVKYTAAEWIGEWPPDPYDHRPHWWPWERTHLQLYETVSEGTPLSPPMPDAESLARWLADRGKAGKPVWTEEPGSVGYEGWMRFLDRGGYAPSAVISADKGFETGVEHATKRDPDHA